MPTQQFGFSLVIVLIFLLIFSMMGLSALEMSVMETKMSRDSWHHDQLLHEAEQALLEVESKEIKQPYFCSIPVISSQTLLAKPLSWWQSLVSCAGNFPMVQYYYVIESLGEDPCAYLDDPHLSVDYFRVTLLGLQVNSGAKIYLQSTLVLPHSGDSAGCNLMSHHVSAGRQMWRILFH
jgi:Tfp pilus assembly protein PilX